MLILNFSLALSFSICTGFLLRPQKRTRWFMIAESWLQRVVEIGGGIRRATSRVTFWQVVLTVDDRFQSISPMSISLK